MTTRIRAPWRAAGQQCASWTAAVRLLRSSCPGPTGLLLAIAIAGLLSGLDCGIADRSADSQGHGRHESHADSRWHAQPESNAPLPLARLASARPAR